MSLDNLRERCVQFWDCIQHRSDPIEEIIAFVVAERGRALADNRLEEALPLCLYFQNDAAREEFMAAMRIAKPQMFMRKTP